MLANNEFEKFFYDERVDGYINETSQSNRKRIEKVKNENKDFVFPYYRNKDEIIKKIEEAIIYLKNVGVDFSKIKIGLDFRSLSDSYFTTSELEKIIQLEECVKSNGAEFVLVAEDVFSLDEIIQVNENLDKEVNYIKNLTIPDENNRPLNDFEKFLMAYDYCTNRKYNECYEKKAKARHVSSVMTGENIVCVGYAKLLKEMCHRLGIKCYDASMIVEDKEYKSIQGHANSIVKLDGKLYYADACWDSFEEKYKDVKLYNHCLIPFDDKNNFKNCNIKYNINTIFRNLDKEKKYISNLLKKSQDSKTMIELSEEDNSFLEVYFNKILKYKETFEDLFLSEEDKKIKFEENLKKIYNFLDKYEYGDAFSYNDFYDAIYNISRAKGASQIDAEKYTTKVMEVNEIRAKEIFTDNATNCFYVGKENNVEYERK